MLERLRKGGIKYVFVSNSDNLGATLDLDLLAFFAKSDSAFTMEARASAHSTLGHQGARGRHAARLVIAARKCTQCIRSLCETQTRGVESTGEVGMCHVTPSLHAQAKYTHHVAACGADLLRACSRNVSSGDGQASFLYIFVQVAERTSADKKGGHLCKRKSDGRLLLRESAMVQDEDKKAFEDISKCALGWGRGQGQGQD